MRELTGIVVGALAGLGWSGPLWCAGFAPCAFFAWLWAPSCGAAAAVMVAYYAVALRPIVDAAPGFFGVPLAVGVCLWAGWVIVSAAPWALLWHVSRRGAGWGKLAASLGVLLVGVLPWAAGHPWSAVGLWAPGTGAWALLLIVAGSWLPLRAGSVALVGSAALTAMVSATEPSSLEGWHGAATRWAPFHAHDYGRQYDAAVASWRALDAKVRVNVLPEGAGGLWNETASRLWNGRLAGQGAVLLGAVRSVAGSRQVDNVLMSLGGGEAYTQRFPMPVAQWVPASGGGVRAHWFGRPTLSVEGVNAGVLICFEQLVPIAAVSAALSGADLLIGVSNLAWFRTEAVERSQRNTLAAWGRLFDLPTVFAVNGHS